MASGFSSSTRTKNKRALLIGNNNYKKERKLNYCINDAEDLGNELRRINFEITIGRNKTCEEMDRMIEDFTDTIHSGDLILFFFAGHGYQWGQQNFLLPIDDDRIKDNLDLKHRSINAQATLEKIMNRSPSSTIFVLDCCRSSFTSRGSSNSNNNGLSTMNAIAGSIIAFACDVNKTTLDGSKNGRNGIFTAHLLQHIIRPNLTIDEIMYDVCDGVMKDTNNDQCPFRVSSLRKKVYLNNKQDNQLNEIPNQLLPSIDESNNLFEDLHIPDNHLIDGDAAELALFEQIKWKQNATTIVQGNIKGCKLNRSQGIFIDNDHTIYIADCSNDRIVQWKCDDMKREIIAGGNGPGSRNDQLYWPTDIFVDKQKNSLIIADSMNRRVMRWSTGNKTNQQILISHIDCWGLTIDKNGFIYVSDREKNEVTRWKQGEMTNGTIVAGGNGRGNNLNQLNFPTFIFVDENDSVYVSDMKNHRVMKWIKDAKEGIVVAGGNGSGDGLKQLSIPQGVIVDHLGQIYVADSWNNRVMRWCEGSCEGSIVVGGNGQGEELNQLNNPSGLSFDVEGNLYVVDGGNNRIQKFLIDFDEN